MNMNISNDDIIKILRSHIDSDYYESINWNLSINRATDFVMDDYLGNTYKGKEFPLGFVNIRLTYDGEFVDADPV